MGRTKGHDRDGVFRRKGSYYISFIDFHGRRRQRKVKGAYTLNQARDARTAELLNVEKARQFGQLPPTDDTLSEIFPQFLAYQKRQVTPESYNRIDGIIENHLEPAFGKIKLRDIRRGDVQRYVTRRMADVAPGSVTKELNTLKHLLNFCVEQELIPANPLYRMKGPRLPAGRVRYLQPAELRLVFEACPEWLRPIAGLLAFTGMRRSEVLRVRWLDLDRPGKRIVLPQTKNGDVRIVPLNALACMVLDSVSRNGALATDRVFPITDDMTPNSVSLAFLRACRKAGIADFRLHDLRHTAASWLRMSGADLQDVADLLGHRDLRMTMRYAHLAPAHRAATVERLDGIFGPELSHLLPARCTKPDAESGHDGVTIEHQNDSKLLQAATN